MECENCNRSGKLETRNDILLKGHYSEPTNLTLLWPEEWLICNSCLKIKTNKATIGIAILNSSNAK